MTRPRRLGLIVLVFGSASSAASASLFSPMCVASGAGASRASAYSVDAARLPYTIRASGARRAGSMSTMLERRLVEAVLDRKSAERRSSAAVRPLKSRVSAVVVDEIFLHSPEEVDRSWPESRQSSTFGSHPDPGRPRDRRDAGGAGTATPCPGAAWRSSGERGACSWPAAGRPGERSSPSGSAGAPRRRRRRPNRPVGTDRLLDGGIHRCELERARPTGRGRQPSASSRHRVRCDSSQASTEESVEVGLPLRDEVRWARRRARAGRARAAASLGGTGRP